MKAISSTAMSALYFVSTVLYFVGLYHSGTKHSTNDLILSVVLPPLAAYRGLEIFWHKDKEIAAKDNSALNDYVKIAVHLIISKPENTDVKAQLKYSNNKNDFRSSLKELNNKELSYIKSGTLKFIEFLKSTQADISSAMTTIKETNNFKFSQSEATSVIANECVGYGLGKEIEDSKQQFAVMENQINSALTNQSIQIETLTNTEKYNSDMKKMIGSLMETYSEFFE